MVSSLMAIDAIDVLSAFYDCSAPGLFMGVHLLCFKCLRRKNGTSVRFRFRKTSLRLICVDDNSRAVSWPSS